MSESHSSGQRRVPESPEHRGESKLPDNITISWLTQNVPIRFWFWLAGLLATAFAAGMEWGPLIRG